MRLIMIHAGTTGQAIYAFIGQEHTGDVSRRQMS